VLGFRLIGRLGNRLTRPLLVSGLTIGLLAMSAGSALAGGDERSGYGPPPGRHTCTGTPEAPGVLAGVYWGNVSVEGSCVVNSGEAVIHGDLTVRSGSVLLAVFALNDKTGSGHSSLQVKGDLRVKDGATMLLGCDPQSFPCIDDPFKTNKTQPTLSSASSVWGNLSEHKPLGVVVHNTTIGGNVKEIGGGGGLSCKPSGAFAAFESPVYSDYEDSTVKGNLDVIGLNSCWLGVARVKVGGDVHMIHNQLADPDAIEIISNHISGDLLCKKNSQVWNSIDISEVEGELYPRLAAPNTVSGHRIGQCVLASPATKGGPLGPGPF